MTAEELAAMTEHKKKQAAQLDAVAAPAAKKARTGSAPAMKLTAKPGTVFGPELADADVQGAIFDIDGTLLDTMPGYFPSWTYACEKLGLAITEGQFYGFAGRPMPDIIKQLHRNAGKGEMPEGYVEQFFAHKKVGMAETHPRGFLPAPIEAVVEIMKGFIARGVPIACATSGLREHVAEHMGHGAW